MSLINEALKKAQRARAAGAPEDHPPIPGGGPIAKRKETRSANTMVLLGSGAVVLVVLSVAVTVYLLNRTSAPPPVATAPAKPKAATSPADSAPATVSAAIPAPAAAETPVAKPPTPAPIVTAPVTPAPVVTTAQPAPTPPPAPTAEKKAAPAPLVTAPVAASAALPVANPPAAAPASATPSAPVVLPRVAPAAMPDERIAAYIESMRIKGVRASGADSRVFINDRIFRVNEIVDRALGIRLLQVNPGSLTFSDANGVSYVKHH